ncbi:MAG: cellulase family glycosylhydrolase [Halococcoides sp.]
MRQDTPSRRTFLRAIAGTGALAASGALLGTAAGEGIPTPWLERGSGSDSNLMKDPEGNPVTLRGVNIADPARLNDGDRRYHVTAEQVTRWALDESDGWYNRIVRIPCQTGDIVGSGHGEVAPGEMTEGDLTDYLETHLRPVVDICAEEGAYCIVDYHRHQDDQLLYTDEALSEEVHLFWEVMAEAFAEDSHVLFEVYNEPIAPYPGHNDYGQDAGVDVADPDSTEAEETWLTWREAAQPWVDTIREHAPQNPIIIGSPRWTQWTWWADEHEFDGDNLAYAGHVYAHENLRPLSEYFGKPAESVPVFMTEFGYDDEGQDFLKGTTSVEGEQFVEFFENHPHVHWQVWCFDPRWEPAMFDEDQGEWMLRDGDEFHGEYFKAYLAEKRDEDLPHGDGTSTTTTTDPTDTTPEGPDWPANATDPDDDGLYEDLSGNDEIDFPDVNTFFQNTGTDRVDRNRQFYDFTEDEEISLQDVMVLFEQI